MTDYDDDQTPNTNALNDARRLQAAAGQRGGYPRGFALATAVWAGVLTTGITAGHDWWFIVLAVGIAGFLYSRHQQGAWVNEATSHSDLLRIFGGATLIVLIGIAGFIGRHKLVARICAVSMWTGRGREPIFDDAAVTRSHWRTHRMSEATLCKANGLR